MPATLRSLGFTLGATALFLIISGCSTTQSSHRSTSAPNTSNRTAHRIHGAIPRYRALAQLPWHTIHTARLPLKIGMQDNSIPLIRERLIQLGDLSKAQASASPHYGKSLKHGVKLFQWRHGLKADGHIGEKTLHILNVSPATRLSQLQNSMDRWSNFPDAEGDRYIHVNVPNFELNLMKDGNSIINMKIIAGKPKRPTPELYSKVQTIVLNPKWNVPRTIARKDIIPKMLKNPDYLTQENIKIYSSWKKDAYEINPSDINWLKASEYGFPYRMSQTPGNHNALGRVKFVFLNKDNVYLHDTPQKGLFAKIQRAFSSGCVRLERPFELVEYFIQESPTLTHEEINKKLSSGETQYIRIRNPIPIFITYITAWVDENGRTHFREDVYKARAEKEPAAV
jgi:murein L,D-transpeptidase YcbB/YkuD